MNRETLSLLATLLASSSVALAQTYDVLDVPVQNLTNSAVAIRFVPAPLFWSECYNPNAAVAYVQVFDVSGSVTVGATPSAFYFTVQPGQSSGMVRPTTQTGSYFPTNALKVAATTTPSGGTAPSSALSCDFGTR